MRSDRYSRILVGAVALALAACMDDPTNPATGFTATLTDEQVTPALTIPANLPVGYAGGGSATCAASGTTFSCTVVYTGLTGAPTVAHIHAANAGVAGGTRVFLCSNVVVAGVPACPTTTAGTITSGAQPPISPNTYAAILTAMQGFGAYVNVHTTANGGGEIRGQIFGVY